MTSNDHARSRLGPDFSREEAALAALALDTTSWRIEGYEDHPRHVGTIRRGSFGDHLLGCPGEGSGGVAMTVLRRIPADVWDQITALPEPGRFPASIRESNS